MNFFKKILISFAIFLTPFLANAKQVELDFMVFETPNLPAEFWDDAIARTVKEKYGYVCKDVAAEFKKFDEKKKGDDGQWYLSNKFKKYMHKPSNGAAAIEIDVGYERFLGPEMFFHPVSTLFDSF